MADFVRDHIGLREFARLAGAAFEAALQFIEERRVEIDFAAWRPIRPIGPAVRG